MIRYTYSTDIVLVITTLSKAVKSYNRDDLFASQFFILSLELINNAHDWVPLQLLHVIQHLKTTPTTQHISEENIVQINNKTGESKTYLQMNKLTPQQTHTKKQQKQVISRKQTRDTIKFLSAAQSR